MPEAQLLLKVILFFVAILIGVLYVAPIFGFDFIRYVTGQTIIKDIYEPEDKSNEFFYEDYTDMGYPGMILERDNGVDNIDDILNTKKVVTACRYCFTCGEISPADPDFDSISCSDCYVCEGKSTLDGDLNGDCIVDEADNDICALAFKSHAGDPDWNPGCDLDDDGVITMLDVILLSNKFGETCIGLDANYKNCLECASATSSEPYDCSLCEDVKEDYEICRKIKDCIRSSASWPDYYAKYGCEISIIPHSDSANFNINDLKNVLSSCRNESITMDIGNNMKRELCYFNNNTITYYDFKRPNDFYLNHKLEASNCISWFSLYSDQLNLLPFYKNGNVFVPKYRVYVAINVTDALDVNNFKIRAGHWHDGGFPLGLITDYDCDLGNIKTDSNGFGYGEFTDFSNCPNEWKDNPEEYHLNGISIGSDPSSYVKFNANVAFYANTPESSETWIKDIRYGRCNFATNPEPYLSRRVPALPIVLPEKPWWAYNPDNLISPWYTFGNPLIENANSSIKVFYDSNMAGGGNSPNRGNIKISLGRLDTDFMRNCKFDVYVCSQDAFAEYDGERILTLADFFTGFNAMNVQKTKKVDVDSDGFEESDFIIYNYFIFGLDKNYNVEEVKSAIKTGFRLWEQFGFIPGSFGTVFDWLRSENNDGIYENSWNEVDGVAGYNEECWNVDVENIMKNNERNILGNCPDNVCCEKLIVRVGFKYTQPNATALGDGWKRPLYPTVTFCSPECGFSFSTWPDPHDSWTEDVHPDFASGNPEVHTNDNDAEWFSAITTYPVVIDNSIYKIGTQSVRIDNIDGSHSTTLALVLHPFGFVVDLNEFDRINFFVRSDKDIPNMKIRFIDNNNNIMAYDSSLTAGVWKNFVILFSDPNWVEDAGFDRTNIFYLTISSGLSSEISSIWADDLYFVYK